jgi:hypothetical protein
MASILRLVCFGGRRRKLRWSVSGEACYERAGVVKAQITPIPAILIASPAFETSGWGTANGWRKSG